MGRASGDGSGCSGSRGLYPDSAQEYGGLALAVGHAWPSRVVYWLSAISQKMPHCTSGSLS